MTMITDERRAKIYALHLLNRLPGDFEVRYLDAIATALPLIEADVANWLASELRGTVSRELVVAGVRAGKHRPPFELKGDAGETLSRHNGDGSLRAEAGDV